MQSINQQLKKAIFQSVLGRYGAYAVQVITMMVYARWFTPEQFGILAAIQVFTTFFMMLAEVGLGPAIINLKKLDEDNRNGLFTITFIIGIFISVIFICGTFFLNSFYNRTDYQYIGIPVCIAVIFYTLNTLPNAFLQRERKFFIIARTDIFSELPTLFIVYLLISHPLIALSTRVLSISIFRFIINYIMAKKTEFGRPRFGSKLNAVRPLLSFSLYQFGFNFVNFFSRNFDNILVGKYISMFELGIYDKAYTLMKYPLQLLTFAMTPAIQPVINKHIDDLATVEKTHRNLMHILSVLAVLVAGLILLNSKLIVLFLLGEKWITVADLLEILSLTIPVQIIMSTSGSFYQALGRPDLLFKCGIFSSIINVSSITYGICTHSLITLCWMLVISFHMNFIQCYFLMYKKIFKESILVFLHVIIKSCLIFMSVICVKYLFDKYYPMRNEIVNIMISIFYIFYIIGFNRNFISPLFKR